MVPGSSAWTISGEADSRESGRGLLIVAQVQRLSFADRSHSYTVIGADKLPIAPAREYLRFLVDSGASPHTVRAYAYGLAAWWTLLEHTHTAWDDFPTSLFGQFLRYLRTGDLPGTSRIGEVEESMAESSLLPRGAAVLSMYRYFAEAHDLDRPCRRLFSSRARAARRRYASFLTGIGPQRDHDTPIYRRRAPNRSETPLLLPMQVNAILDACSVQTDSGQWSGGATGLRDRLFLAVLAETGMRMGEALSLRHHDFHISGGDTPSIVIAGRNDHPHGVRAKSGARRIYVGDDLVALYSEYVWQLIADGADVAVPDLATHFVFVNLTRGEKYAPVARRAGVQRKTIYKYPELIAVIDQYRHQTNADPTDPAPTSRESSIVAALRARLAAKDEEIKQLRATVAQQKDTIELLYGQLDSPMS